MIEETPMEPVAAAIFLPKSLKFWPPPFPYKAALISFDPWRFGIALALLDSNDYFAAYFQRMHVFRFCCWSQIWMWPASQKPVWSVTHCPWGESAGPLMFWVFHYLDFFGILLCWIGGCNLCLVHRCGAQSGLAAEMWSDPLPDVHHVTISFHHPPLRPGDPFRFRRQSFPTSDLNFSHLFRRMPEVFTHPPLRPGKWFSVRCPNLAYCRFITFPPKRLNPASCRL